MKFLEKSQYFLEKFYVMFLQLEGNFGIGESQSASSGNSLFFEKVYLIVYLLLFYSIVRFKV